ncbi:PIG-L deacetylase family protein [Streptomyces sp. Tu6071]|uniref:PIG-L deacetylase family protein n=1 Tax=Streptomyces sp. Tu6071 TaxID=355249 RepID=UPI000318D9DD|nr:PIG-L family deacetylase [Streptomyces sp. Tu6071]
MSGPDPIQAPGTDEALWRAWERWAELREVVLPQGPVVVVAAHPDDEVLGAGGALALLAAAGNPLTVVTVTDGEGSHPRTRVLRPPALAARRATELRAALARLGASAARTVRLRVPDTAVAAHEEEVRRALVPLTEGAALVLAPWTGDVHADHEATGRAARAAARETGAPSAAYPVWMWHWARPDDPRVPWHRAARLDLPADVRARKRDAVACFRSQIAPLGPAPEDAAILPPAELAHHVRDFEVWFA